MSLDHSIVLFLNDIAQESPAIKGTVVFFARYVPYVLVTLFILFVVYVYSAVRVERQKAVLFVQGFAAAIISWLCSQALQLFVHRLRPFISDQEVHALVEKTSYSFPSGHASFFFALSTVVYLHNKRVGILFYVASAAIGLARVATGVHYPTDILGGAILGIAVGWLVHRAFLHFRKT